MKKVTPLFFLILILAFFASLLIFGKILIYKKTPTSFFPIPTITPSPTSPTFVNFSPTPLIKEGIGESPKSILDSLKKKFPLIEFLPYETANFSLDYIAPFYLEVKIKQPTISAQIKQEVLNWIISHKISMSD
ncbi:MAG: hypothetical protein QW279_10200 [Candidatus Jordarchaeaceae archaeon]